ncbi:MAG: hypothetical protein PHE50_03230 [Dehalococcoidales bacterium]|nr:hypothetical protein [Dehalococcoidales bacterium]
MNASCFLVGLLSSNPNPDYPLALTNTDVNGNFSFQDIPNNVNTRYNICIYTSAKYTPNNYEVMTIIRGGTGWNDVYSYYQEITLPNYSDYYDAGGLNVPNDPTIKAAWWIKNDLSLGFVSQPTQSPSSFIAEWTYGQNAYINGVLAGGYYSSPHIVIGTANETSGVVLHEMGHNIQDNFYNVGITNLTCNHSPGHNIYQSCYSGRAWGEGWAEFWRDYVSQTYNLEALRFENNSTGDSGDSVVARVAGALWDIYDSVNDGYDQFNGGIGFIWSTLDANDDQSFQSFWNHLKGNYGSDFASQAPSARALYQNTIIYPEFGYHVTTTTTGGNGNVTLTPTGGYYANNTIITVNAIPNTGYHFNYWGGDISGVSSPTTVFVNGDKNIVAHFAPNTYTLTISSGSGGTVTTPGIGTFGPYNSGSQVNIVASPNSGYQFVNWTGNTGAIANPNAANTTITMNGDYSIQANFAPDNVTYYLTTSTSSGGTVTTPGIGTFGPYNQGQNVGIVATSNTGYHFVNWTGNTGTIANVNSANTYITMYGNYFVHANFAPNMYTLTYTSGAGGYISGATPQTVEYGGSGTPVTAVPNTGYHFLQWSDGVMTTTRTDTNVTANLSVTAYFAANTYTLTVSSGSGGTVTTPGVGTFGPYNSGSQVNIVASPNSGYQFVNWTGNTGTIANVNSANTYITMYGAYSIQANFAPDTWSNSVTLTIDYTKLEANTTLSHFPVMLHLSTDAGINSSDLSAIFNTLGTNSKKLAVRDNTTGQQLYVEVEKWDSTNKEAVLWVSRDSWTISSTADTVLTLYYDAAHADNTSFVGETGSAPAQQVWDSNYKAVYHMAGSGNTIADSTVNGNTGTKSATDGPTETNGLVGKAQHFDGVDDSVNGGNGASLNVTSAITIEALINTAGTSGDPRGIIAKGTPWWSPFNGYELDIYSGTIRWAIGNGSAYAETRPAFNTTGIYVNISATFDNADRYLRTYVDGVANTPALTTFTSIGVTGSPLIIGRLFVGDPYLFTGYEDEVRISNTARSAAWIKATYATCQDNLISYTSNTTRSLEITANGGGTVTTPGEGVFGPYTYSHVVNLLATPNTGYHFVNWSGDTGTIADPNAASTTITMNGNYTIQPYFEPSVTLSSGFNFYSTSFTPTNTDPGIVFAGLGNNIISCWYYKADTATWYTWEPGLGGDITAIADGFGYQIDMQTSSTQQVTGSFPTSFPSSRYTVYGPSLWNQVGMTAYHDMTCSQYFGDLYPYIQQMVTIVNGSYVYLDIINNPTIHPGQAFWLLTTTNTRLLSPGSGMNFKMAGIPTTSRISTSDWSADISLRSPSGLKTIVKIGVSQDTSEIDDWAVPPIAPIPGNAQLYISRPEKTNAIDRKLGQNYVKPNKVMAWPLAVWSANSKSVNELTINWDMQQINSLPKEYSLWITDKAGKKLVDMRSTTSYTFQIQSSKNGKETIIDFQIQAQIE